MRHAREVRDVPYQPRGGAGVAVESLRLRELFERLPNRDAPDLEMLQFDMWVFFAEGRSDHLLDFVSHRCVRGSVLHIAAGQIHRWDPGRSVDGFALMVNASPDRAPALPGQGAGPLPGRSTQRLPPVVQAKIWQWLAQLSEERLGGPLAWHLAMVVLHELARSGQVPHANEGVPDVDVGRVQRLRAAIEAEFRNTRRAQTYARRLSCSLRTLDRTCLRVAGRTVKQLVDARVLLEAQRRLAYTPVTLEQLADELGFCDASNLAKFFRHHLGKTPGEFRRAYRPGGSAP